MFEHVSDMLVFAAVVRLRSITHAAKALQMPKSSVSRRVSALEDRVGSRLLYRSPRRITLTEAGEAFRARCEQLEGEVDDALAFANSLADVSHGRLRVTMPPNFGGQDVAEAIASFSAEHPNIQLELDESQRYVDLVAERFDVAFRAGTLPDSTLVARRLMTLEHGVFASPAYLERVRAPRIPGDLARHDFVILEGRTRFDRIELRRGKQRAEVALTGRITATSTNMQLRLVLAGAGAAMLATRYCADKVRSGSLVRLLPGWSSEPSPLWVVTPSRRLVPRKTALFVQHLLARLNGSRPATGGSR